MKLSFNKFIPGIAWFFVVLVIMCLPGKEIPEIGWLENINFDKLLHIGVFALQVILLCWPFKNSAFDSNERLPYFIKIALATGVWGITTELIQKYLVPGRYFDVLDCVADCLGAMMGFWFCRRRFLRSPKAE